MINPLRKMKLQYYPKGDVTQYFAENPALYARFDLKGHNGIDLVRPHGEMMYAIEDGIVLSTKDEPEGFGKNVRMLSKAKADNGHYRLWTYAHNSANLVQQGDEVKAGQAIAMMGNTGFVISGSTPYWKNNPYAGTHVHLGLRYANKTRLGWSYPGSDIKIDIINHDNGFKGSVDPLPELYKCQDQLESDTKRQILLTLISVYNAIFKKKGL